jgi:glutaredoxin 3
MTSAIIWSKDGCGFCTMAKQLLTYQNIPYEERNISGDEWTREQLLEAVPTAKTLPQIFLDGEYLGGYAELKQRLG